MTEFRRAERRDDRELLELINLVQPHVPWSEEHYRWQFRGSPAGPARLYVAEEDGRLVSLYAAVAHRVRVDGVLRTGLMIQDVMTHPDHRGKGHLHELGRLCLEEIQANGDLGFTFPNERSERSFRRNGWVELCAVPWRHRGTASLGSAAEPGARKDMRFSELAGAIWSDSGLRIGVERDTAYLEWRYSRPGACYRRLLCEDFGFLVLKLYQPGAGPQVLHICDLVVRASFEKRVGSLLGAAVAVARAEGASEVTAWLPEGHPYAEAFDLLGLRHEAGGGRFIFTTGPQALVETGLLTAGNWHLTQGDSDVY